MSGSVDGFAFTFMSPSINAAGGKERRTLLVVAQDLQSAGKIARQMISTVTFEAKGPDILARARQLGVGDNDARIEGR